MNCRHRLRNSRLNAAELLTAHSACHKTIRYRSSIPPEVDLRAKLRDLANERRRFGYRRLLT
ncbi:hypothetical protein ASD52_04755 [Ensifer sp. Root142]|nr:hypothetical protein ASD52_04755 [Ensifer sp. Root142]